MFLDVPCASLMYDGWEHLYFFLLEVLLFVGVPPIQPYHTMLHPHSHTPLFSPCSSGATLVICHIYLYSLTFSLRPDDVASSRPWTKHLRPHHITIQCHIHKLRLQQHQDTILHLTRRWWQQPRRPNMIYNNKRWMPLPSQISTQDNPDSQRKKKEPLQE